MSNVERAARLASSKTLRLAGLAVAAGVARERGVQAPLRTASLAATGGHAAGAALSRIVRRRRPPTAEESDDASFPSTHAASAFAVAAALGTKPPLAAALFAGASIVAVSRLVLGEHHVADVVAGALLGIGVGDLVSSRPRS